jgi:hypothetical protein
VQLPSISYKSYEISSCNGSVYRLKDELNSQSTTLAQQEYYKKRVGLKVSEDGYITNVYKFAGYHVTINESSSSTSTSISCAFDNSWDQKIQTLNIPYKTSFTGIISGSYILPVIELSGCELK